MTDWADVAMRTGLFFFALLLFYLTYRFSRAAPTQGNTPAQQKMWPFLGVSSYLLATSTSSWCATNHSRMAIRLRSTIEKRRVLEKRSGFHSPAQASQRSRFCGMRARREMPSTASRLEAPRVPGYQSSSGPLSLRTCPPNPCRSIGWQRVAQRCQRPPGRLIRPPRLVGPRVPSRSFRLDPS